MHMMTCQVLVLGQNTRGVTGSLAGTVMLGGRRVALEESQPQGELEQQT